MENLYTLDISSTTKDLPHLVNVVKEWPPKKKYVCQFAIAIWYNLSAINLSHVDC